jgi:hypothetical protein
MASLHIHLSKSMPAILAKLDDACIYHDQLKATFRMADNACKEADQASACTAATMQSPAAC